MLPSGHALAFQFMSDNSGSTSSVSEVLQYYQSLRNAFPGAHVVPSSLDKFYAEAQKIKDQLSVTVTGEVGDVWIQGVQTVPMLFPSCAVLTHTALSVLCRYWL